MSNPILSALTPNQLKLEILREHFPQAVEVDAQGRLRINPAGLQQAIDPSNPAGIQVEEDGYELRWVGKREAYHSAFVPVQKIINPLPDESKNWDTTGNVLMRGDNLDALRLLRHSYFGTVKLIYIDPPYNTQSDAFIYRDDFSAKQSEVFTQLGYSADNIDYIKNIYGARTHSGWLSFMYPRLLLAKDLLKDDGVIFISIDDNEQAQLKILCDEIFGQEAFVAQLIWQKGKEGGNDNIGFGIHHEYVLCYAKTSSLNIKLNLDEKDLSRHKTELPEPNLVKGVAYIYKEGDLFQLINLSKQKDYRVKIPLLSGDVIEWDSYCPQTTINEYIAMGKVFVGVKGVPYIKSFMDDEKQGSKPSSLIDSSYGTTKAGGIAIRNLLGDGRIFNYPKAPSLLQRLTEISTDPNDIVLDFFAGSGTTGEAVMQLNAEDGGHRKFILVQIPQPIDPKKQKEAHSFVTETLGKPDATIFEITAERLRRAGVKIEAEKPDVDTGFRVFDLVDDPDALIISKPLQDATQDDVKKLQAAIAMPQPAQLPRVLYNLLLGESLPLTTPLQTIKDQSLYLALSDKGNVALIVHPMPLKELTDTLRQLQTDGTPAVYLTVYAPWIADDNFMLGIKTMAESLGYSEDKLRLRG